MCVVGANITVRRGAARLDRHFSSAESRRRRVTHSASVSLVYGVLVTSSVRRRPPSPSRRPARVGTAVGARRRRRAACVRRRRQNSTVGAARGAAWSPAPRAAHGGSHLYRLVRRTRASVRAVFGPSAARGTRALARAAARRRGKTTVTALGAAWSTASARTYRHLLRRLVGASSDARSRVATVVASTSTTSAARRVGAARRVVRENVSRRPERRARHNAFFPRALRRRGAPSMACQQPALAGAGDAHACALSARRSSLLASSSCDLFTPRPSAARPSSAWRAFALGCNFAAVRVNFLAQLPLRVVAGFRSGQFCRRVASASVSCSTLTLPTLFFCFASLVNFGNE